MIILSEEQFCWFSAEPAGIIAELNAFPYTLGRAVRLGYADVLELKFTHPGKLPYEHAILLHVQHVVRIGDGRECVLSDDSARAAAVLRNNEHFISQRAFDNAADRSWYEIAYLLLTLDNRIIKGVSQTEVLVYVFQQQTRILLPELLQYRLSKVDSKSCVFAGQILICLSLIDTVWYG